MIIKDIFDKEELCYALISSYNEPNMLIPVKAQIKDIKFHFDQPNYEIKILKFYDNFNFIKKYVINMKFYSHLNSAKKNKLYLGKFNDNEGLQNVLDSKDITVVVHSLNTFKLKSEMKDVFDKLNDYFIYHHLFKLKETMTRRFYSGSLKLNSENEYYQRLRNFIEDKFPNKRGDTFEKILDRLRYSKPISELRHERAKNKAYKRKS